MALGKLEYCVLKCQKVVFSNKMERSAVRKWAMMGDAQQSAEVQSKILFKSVHCSSSLHLALLEGNHITRDH